MAAFLFAAPALAQYPPPTTPPPSCTSTVDDTAVTPGQVVTITGTADPGTTVQFSVAGRSIGAADVGSDGSFTATVTIPSDLAPGTYTLTTTVVCNGTTTTLGVEVSVSPTGAGGGGGGGGPLPRTGFNLAPVASVGAALLILGAAAIYGARRKRQLPA
ncbi:MAG: LPXTG cell wall anchor domain-containing protein [Actinobacteria bacterium]|nr:LPXTG cell wall anchor domain-containing protein [Actinomycetota bacterium]